MNLFGYFAQNIDSVDHRFSFGVSQRGRGVVATLAGVAQEHALRAVLHSKVVTH